MCGNEPHVRHRAQREASNAFRSSVFGICVGSWRPQLKNPRIHAASAMMARAIATQTA